MGVKRFLNIRVGAACALWVAACFFLTSATYMSWFYRLIDQTGGTTADLLSMVAGYMMQAAGLGLVFLRLRERPDGDGLRRLSAASLSLFAACFALAMIGGALAGTIAFGLMMNLLCGVIAGFYLYALAVMLPSDRRGVAFGGGYGAATVALGLLALVGSGFMRGGTAPLVWVPFALVLALLAARLPAPRPPEAVGRPAELPGKKLALTCAAALLLSLVKNLGFGFPSADIRSGLMPELSRVLYAVGLVAAGCINDRSRKNGAICTAAALVIPFVMLGLAGESVSNYVCWGLDYLFFGFFSVYRVVLFLDLAEQARRWELVPLGLLFGRLGDAAGTAICILFDSAKIALIAVTTMLFMLTIFLFYRLCLWLYAPKATRPRSEREVFDGFALQHDLSAREQEVLRLLLAKRSNCEIAEALFVSESTVKYHVHNLLQKTGCKNRGEMQKKFALSLYPQGNEDHP